MKDTAQYQKLKELGEFPDGPVVKIPSFHCLASGPIPGQGAKIPQAAQNIN